MAEIIRNQSEMQTSLGALPGQLQTKSMIDQKSLIQGVQKKQKNKKIIMSEKLLFFLKLAKRKHKPKILEHLYGYNNRVAAGRKEDQG